MLVSASGTAPASAERPTRTGRDRTRGRGGPCGPLGRIRVTGNDA